VRKVRPELTFGLFAVLVAAAGGCHRDHCLPLCEATAKALHCAHPGDCKLSCTQLHETPVCVPEFKEFETCFLEEPPEHWECDDNGVPALKEGVCGPQRAGVLACLQAHPPPLGPPAQPAKKP
jgi:hypothetical protein